jgi:ring-1,2-phenylacetyl-CoA epoxidase subunit PaaC
MYDEIKGGIRDALFEYTLRLADDRLILGHRLSELCGHAPILEEDIALTNIALDNIGQANALFTLASELKNDGTSPDDLAFLREAVQFKNLQLLEQPNRDFAYTIARQFLFDNYSMLFSDRLSASMFKPLSGIAQKALKESRYHYRHSSEWVLRLGDGTEESHSRIQRALDDLWGYTDELFVDDETDQLLEKEGIGVNLSSLRSGWETAVGAKLSEATLKIPDGERYFSSGSRKGVHSEHLGHLLAEMQIVPRSFPGAKW